MPPPPPPTPYPPTCKHVNVCPDTRRLADCLCGKKWLSQESVQANPWTSLDRLLDRRKCEATQMLLKMAHLCSGLCLPTLEEVFRHLHVWSLQIEDVVDFHVPCSLPSRSCSELG